MNKRRRFKAKRRRDHRRMWAERYSRRFWRRFMRDVRDIESSLARSTNIRASIAAMIARRQRKIVRPIEIHLDGCALARVVLNGINAGEPTTGS